MAFPRVRPNCLDTPVRPIVAAICNAVPFNSYLLLRGEVSGDTAQVIVWDVIGGRKIDFATLRLARDGSVLTVVPTGGMNHLFPGSARIAKSSPEPTPDPERVLPRNHGLFGKG